MPIIASETIHINVKEDNSIEVKFLEELNHNKCINLPLFASTDTENNQLHDIVKRLVGEKVIECEDEICCISDNYYGLVKRLTELRT